MRKVATTRFRQKVEAGDYLNAQDHRRHRGVRCRVKHRPGTGKRSSIPKDARARFFNGLAKEHTGDRISALADWSALLQDANFDEPSLPDLKIGSVSSGVRW